MSALAFLSKKSWHTGLQQNQEAVWKAEKSALEERRKLDELRKERDREREIQELERLQEESGGKKRRVEKVDWMYNAPSGGSSNVNKDELEDYLLGKKRVDKLLKADEGLKHWRGNQEGPIEEQKAFGTDRDVAAKIREDPMFAIKQQEQAAYQALLKDPARLRAMKKAAGIETESKEERRRRKEEKRRRKEEDSRDRYGSSSSGRRVAEDGERERERYSSRYDDRRRADSYYRHDERDDRRRGRNDSYDDRRQERYARPFDARGSETRDNYRRRDEHSPQYNSRRRSRSPVARQIPSEAEQEAQRLAKIAAMQQNANDLTSTRTNYLDKLKQEEDENARKEQELREKLQKSREKGYGDGKGSFLAKQQKDLYGTGMDLNERLKRSRDGLQRFDGD